MNIDGKAKIKIPPGTQSGKIFRLKGKGFPAVNSYEKGDQLIHVNIWTPQHVSSDEKAMLEKIDVVFPNQSSWGTHLNIAGGAVAKNSKNAENAVKFLEYLASASAQNHFANGNNEWPAARGVTFDNPALKAMSGGNFKSEVLPISVVGMNQIKVQQMLDRVGFK